MRFLDTILGIVFPVSCPSCGKKGSDLCAKCLLASPGAERECAEWIFPLFDYRHKPLKDALWLLKYKGRKRLARVFAEVLYGRMLEELSELGVMENFREALLVPIPLSGSRLRERGFNQALLLCESLVALDNNQNFKLEKNVLIKPKETEHQAKIEDRQKRLKNIIGSFAVKNPELIQKKNIILIDDITTTGATLHEAKKILRAAGARKVIAFTVAH